MSAAAASEKNHGVRFAAADCLSVRRAGLRKERQYCRHISVFLKTSPFAIKEPYYGNVATEKLLIPTQDTWDIIVAATTALERIRKDGHRYAKASVMLYDFTVSGILQLFDERPPYPHSDELMKFLDGINHSGLVCGTRDCSIMANETRYDPPLRMPPAGKISPLRGSVKFSFSGIASSAHSSRTTGRRPRVIEEAPGNKTDIISLRTVYRNKVNIFRIAIVIETVEQSGESAYRGGLPGEPSYIGRNWDHGPS